MRDQKDNPDVFLSSCVKAYKIFIDTSSILSENADVFWQNVRSYLSKENKILCVPMQVFDEVKKYAEDVKDCYSEERRSLNSRAKNAMNAIAALKNDGLIEISGEKQNVYVDVFYRSLLEDPKRNCDMMLITQDHALKDDIMKDSNCQSDDSAYRILVTRLDKDGFLSDF